MPHRPLPVGSKLTDRLAATLDRHSPRKPPIASGGATRGGRSGDRAAALRPPDRVSITRCLEAARQPTNLRASHGDRRWIFGSPRPWAYSWRISGAVLLLGARHRQVGAPLRDSNGWSRPAERTALAAAFRSFPASRGTSITTTTTALVISALHTCVATEVQLKGAARCWSRLW
jgi:hypothetical protein